jgi:hypothetical protein
MNPEKLLELYKEFYFREDETRVSLASRLQIPLAINLSFTSVYAYMIRGLDLNFDSPVRIAFAVTLVIGAGLFITGLVFLIRAFFGHTYSMLPPANQTESYRQELIQTYSGYSDGDVLVEKYFHEYLCRYFNECSSVNTEINDNRSRWIHRSNTFSILNAPLLVVAFLIFTLAGIDKNENREYRVCLQQPVTIETKKQPISITGEIRPSQIEVDFSAETKEVIRVQQTAITAAATTPSAEAFVKGGCTPTSMPTNSTAATSPATTVIKRED